MDYQLISLLEVDDDLNNQKLEIIFYVCCILGGYDSIDYLIHLLVFNITDYINIDLTLYHPFKINILDRMNKTYINYKFYTDLQKKKINNFINFLKTKKKLINNKKINYSNKLYESLYNSTISLRGFNQFINFNKIYYGNINDKRGGSVHNFFINSIDIDIMKKLINKYGENKINMINIFRLYFQTSQLLHKKSIYYINRQTLYNKFKIHNFKSKSLISNLITSLIYFGDCRAHGLILEFYLCIIEFDNFIDLLKNYNKNKNKIIDLIKNPNRLISVNIFGNGLFKKEKWYLEFLFKKLNNNNKIIKNHKQLNYKNKIYLFFENHNFVIHFKYNKDGYNFKLKDIMYTELDLKLQPSLENDSSFIGDYIINNKNVKYIKKYNLLLLGKNDFCNDVNMIGKITKLLFKKQKKYNLNLNNKLLYLGHKITLNKNFFNLDEFIIERENEMYKLRIKYMKSNQKINKFSNKQSNNLEYFLIKNIRNLINN